MSFWFHDVMCIIPSVVHNVQDILLLIAPISPLTKPNSLQNTSFIPLTKGVWVTLQNTRSLLKRNKLR